MRSLNLQSILLAAAVTPLALAQSINYSQLPSCAQQCTLLTQANAACVSAPSYLSCFCQSAYLATFYQTPIGICDAYCPSQADLVSIQKWYLSTCQNGAAKTAPATAAPVTSGVVVSTGTSVAGATPTPSSGSSSSSSTTTSGNATWWSQHYQWIVMVIVLLIAFAIIIFVGVMLKRRHIRKRNEAGNLAPPVAWGPTQNQNATRGVEYRGGSSEKGKGKGSRGPAITENHTLDPEKGSKLKKLLGR